MAQVFSMAQSLEAASLARLLPEQAAAALRNDSWQVFVSGAVTTHILRTSVTLGGPVPSGKNLSGGMSDARVDEVRPTGM
jgi:hypothetical protein